MPANPNGQFEYPETGWSTGNMRMAKVAPVTDPGYPIRELIGQKKKKETKAAQAEGQHPALSPEEWQGYWSGSQGPVLSGKSGKVGDPSEHPQGLIIEKGHPQTKDLEGTHDFYSIPDEGWSNKYLFIKPKGKESVVS
jgi:hypothetical protein